MRSRTFKVKHLSGLFSGHYEPSDPICLNRTFGDVNLDAIKRKPFDVFAEGLDLKRTRGDWI
jgi:hypothetical protein